ncbi:MAG: 30S ribosome-binding factor RbfA [Spirochaetes bacterium]|nr:30S ribosome-binding factor RbfA [Spirochaetota bacterium]
MPGYRKERLEKQIRMIVADALIKDIKDPRIGFVTVTGAKLNKDKSAVVVSVSVMGDEKSKNKSMIGLNSAKGFFQYKIGREMKMRNTPKIVFKLDSSIEYGVEMVNTITKIEEERVNRELSNNPEEDNDER